MAHPATIVSAPDVAREPMDSLGSLLAASRFSLSQPQLAQLEAYRDLLHTRNQTTNLTAVRDLPGIEKRLILESLRLVAPIRSLPRIDEKADSRLLDLGTGGGIPGMVLAIACPDLRVTLLDATGKKVAFLDEAIRELGLEYVSTHHGRAEEVGHDPRWRNRFDVVTARAVASLPALLELGLPLVRTGGHLVLPKGNDIDEELDQAERVAAILGAVIVSADLLPDAGSTIETRLVIVRKVATTPRTYPRRSGLPTRNPLGATSQTGRRKPPGSES
jgi:16S rRNA (guanine527-N7)-methyltransferase